MKKDLDADLGKLVALKLLNRDELAEKLGISRPNLISAFKGRRQLPHKYFALLVEILGLTHKIKFRNDIIHSLTVTNASKQYYPLYDVLYTLANTPLTQVALLSVIGEKMSGYGYILKDSKNAYIIVRDDEKTLSYYDEEDSFSSTDQNFKKYFRLEDYTIHKEVEVDFFEKLMTKQASLTELKNFIISKNQKIWTWEMLQKKAYSEGLTANKIAKLLKFDEK